mgnify:FL=1
MSPNQAELIRKIRTMREQKGITYQQIVDACELAGESVCKATVQKVMTAPIESVEQCRLTTLQSVARAVIGDAYNQETVPQENIEALKVMLAAREEMDRERQQGIVDRTEQIIRMQSTIEEQQAEIKRKSRTIKVMITWAAIVTLLLIMVAAGLLSYLIWDYMHPDIGMIQR